MSLARKDLTIYLDVRDWMAQEARFKMSSLMTRSYSQARNERDLVIQKRLPMMWHGFQELRRIREVESSGASERLKLLVGQKALASCMLAQSAYVMEHVLNGGEVRHSLKASFLTMDHYVDDIRGAWGKLPTSDLLALPLNQAINTYEGQYGLSERPVHVLRSIVGLTLAGLSEQTVGQPLLPAPGHQMGDVVAWQQPRLQPHDIATSE